MTNYVICEKAYAANHAGPKARTDISIILGNNGWEKIYVKRCEDGNFVDKIKALPININDWNSISKKVKYGDNLLIQFPLAMYPQVSRTAIPQIKKIRNKGVKLIFLIHDLDSLRGYKKNVEKDFLSCADVIIAHNDAMRKYISQCEYCEKVISLNLFDYLITDKHVLSECTGGIDIAGNLKPEKAGYIYILSQLMPDASINLYGPNIQRINSVIESWYKGSFPPEQLVRKMRGRFGLVWDGNSVNTCDGEYGEYLRFNNPHKLSMYLAIGKPVIVWKESALADFVEKNGIGFAVDDLYEAIQRADSIAKNEWENMYSNVLSIRSNIINGKYILTAVDKCLK